MAQTQMLKSSNGIDVDALKNTIGEIQKNPSLAKFSFGTDNRWLTGGHNRSAIGDFHGAGQKFERLQAFVVDCDEPPVLLGQDQAPNPVEHLLNALAGCLTSSMVYHAAARGIEIDSVRSHLDGALDIRGFLGLSKDVPKGYQEIRVKMHVKSDAPAEKLKELAMFSPVHDTLTRAVRVQVDIVKE